MSKKLYQDQKPICDNKDQIFVTKYDKNLQISQPQQDSKIFKRFYSHVF